MMAVGFAAPALVDKPVEYTDDRVVVAPNPCTDEDAETYLPGQDAEHHGF